jgi:predicted dehydrogenase
MGRGLHGQKSQAAQETGEEETGKTGKSVFHGQDSKKGRWEFQINSSTKFRTNFNNSGTLQPLSAAHTLLASAMARPEVPFLDNSNPQGGQTSRSFFFNENTMTVDRGSGGSALVGTGFIGPVHVEALRRMGRPITGILGSTPTKGRAAATALRLPRAYDSLEELLADPTVTAVHLTSPNRLHFEQCRQVLAAGKHVICEKPLAMNSQETGELVRLAASAPGVAAVCYNVRFYPLCLEARARIAAGQLGQVYHATGSYFQDWLLRETDFNWRVLAEEGGPLRAVADIGTHWLDLVQYVTGLPVERLCADLRTVLPTRRRPRGSVATFQGKLEQATATEEIAISTEDYASVLFHLAGGARGCCTVSQVTAGRKNCIRFEIAGSNSSLAWNSERPNELWIGRREEPNELLLRDPALLRPEARTFASYPGGHNEGFPDTFKQLFRAIYDHIDTGDRQAPPPFPTFADGHREVVLCEAVLQSQRERRWVDVR